MNARPRLVIDTNVLFEGLTKRGGAAGLVVEAWLHDLIQSCVSNTLAYEYMAVLSNKLSTERWDAIKPVLGTLLSKAEFVPLYFSWRPASNDPGDEHVIDCAMNAGAVVVTYNLRDFQLAKKSLGLQVISPVELIKLLAKL